MTYAVFKDVVASYLNRSAASVVSTASVDMILDAMNNARRFAQRTYTFEGNATQAFVSLSMIPKSMLTDFKTTPALSTTVVVRRIDAVWEYSTATVGATTVYYPTKKIELRRRLAVGAYVPANPNDTSLSSPLMSSFAYVHGVNIAHTNLTAATTVLADVIPMIADHDGGAGEDIFLTYYSDWLKFATLASLNVWLKDSERTPIDQMVINQLWESVKQFDTQQAISTDDLSLD